MARATKTTPTPAASTAAATTPAPDQLDTSVLEALVGYNARRASIAIGAEFFERMAPYGLKQADFSVLALLAHNPGATSRQLCATLDILPPNFVSLIAALDRRGLIERRPHPRDGRAVGLHLTPAGHALAQETEKIVVEMENELAGRLSERERATLQRLLQKFYLRGKSEARGAA
jgi:DNA-binding MarR family transcriptional regulator